MSLNRGHLAGMRERTTAALAPLAGCDGVAAGGAVGVVVGLDDGGDVVGPLLLAEVGQRRRGLGGV